MKSRSEKQSLSQLLAEIESNRIGADWQLSMDYLFCYTDSKREDFVRYCYQAEEDSRLAFCEWIGAEDIEHLLGFLKQQGFCGGEQAFLQAGYYLGPEHGAEWLAFFHSLCASRIQNHSIDKEELQIALSACRRVEDGLHFYCLAHFSLEQLINDISKLYMQRAGIAKHELSRAILKDFIYKQNAFRLPLEEVLLPA